MESILVILVFLVVALLRSIYALQIPVLHNGNENNPINHVPFIASLRLDEVDESFFGKGHFCTGVFISRRSVLTLASCFLQNDAWLQPPDVRVVGGTKYKYEEDSHTFSTVLDWVFTHANFSRTSLENNIAIGLLRDMLPKDNEYVRSINLISDESPAERLRLKIYGWSLTTRYEQSPHLLEGDVEIAPIDECHAAFNKITSSTICAGPYSVNGCETDDGAPLVTEDGVLYGLIDARAAGYCSKIIIDRLGTYVDVSKFYEWILEHNLNAVSRTATIRFAFVILSALISSMWKFSI